jgi:hypothetical protein
LPVSIRYWRNRGPRAVLSVENVDFLVKKPGFLPVD